MKSIIVIAMLAATEAWLFQPVDKGDELEPAVAVSADPDMPRGGLEALR